MHSECFHLFLAFVCHIRNALMMLFFSILFCSCLLLSFVYSKLFIETFLCSDFFFLSCIGRVFKILFFLFLFCVFEFFVVAVVVVIYSFLSSFSSIGSVFHTTHSFLYCIFLFSLSYYFSFLFFFTRLFFPYFYFFSFFIFFSNLSRVF